jgi:hypothetical protein
MILLNVDAITTYVYMLNGINDMLFLLYLG